jgi:type II secretory pathway pseudopilin PulG
MPHPPQSSPARRGFTIVEIAVILIIIALMMIIIIPHVFIQVKERKARRVKADLITLNTAIEHYALDNGKVGGIEIKFADLRKYLDTNSDIYKYDGHDIFGDSYGPFIVGSRPAVPPETAKRLSNVAGPEFWSPFQ